MNSKMYVAQPGCLAVQIENPRQGWVDLRLWKRFISSSTIASKRERKKKLHRCVRGVSPQAHGELPAPIASDLVHNHPPEGELVPVYRAHGDPGVLVDIRMLLYAYRRYTHPRHPSQDG